MRKKSFRNLILVTKLGIAGVLVALNSEAGVIRGVNHTNLSINHFSVDGQSGVDVIGPYQSGGGGCCYAAPERWKTGLQVQVDWQTGAGAGSELAREFPGYENWAQYLIWRDKVVAQRQKYSKIVPIPDYANQGACGITVHFLPCDEVKVTTSCHSFGSPEYPIKLPLKLEEVQSCSR